MKFLPNYLDRYPAKMVTTLADKIVNDYVEQDSIILDPFCGSGAILKASQKKSNKLIGLDINPYAILLSNVKLNGFDSNKGLELLERILQDSKSDNKLLLTSYENVDYWFTASTLNKLYKIRFHLKKNNVFTTREGLGVLLAFALSIRLVSKADQRSPKPFISKIARENRKGKHFDPYMIVSDIFKKLCSLYGELSSTNVILNCKNATNADTIGIEKNSITHLITSPPYINAQDYFRNSKLELYFLEGIIPFSIKNIKSSFIGSEFGILSYPDSLNIENIDQAVHNILKTNKKLSMVVSKYFYDMNKVFDSTFDLLKKNGTFILVCGDNIVGGEIILTWQILNQMLESKGYKIVDTFTDKILKRSLAPNRMGHKSLIKDEKVTVFQKGLIGQ
jgi:site-specific DNA-methyltransferase (cytosine-N4-specific)